MPIRFRKLHVWHKRFNMEAAWMQNLSNFGLMLWDMMKYKDVEFVLIFLTIA